MINETIKEFGKVDILVNNAGVGDKMQAAENVEDEVWERAMSINVDGIMRATRQVIPVFLQNGSGNIINMASISGLTGGAWRLYLYSYKTCSYRYDEKHRIPLWSTRNSL